MLRMCDIGRDHSPGAPVSRGVCLQAGAARHGSAGLGLSPVARCPCGILWPVFSRGYVQVQRCYQHTCMLLLRLTCTCSLRSQLSGTSWSELDKQNGSLQQLCLSGARHNVNGQLPCAQDLCGLVCTPMQSRPTGCSNVIHIISGGVLCRLTGFFKGLGVKAVLDTNTGRDIALLEAAAEFIERYKAAHPGHEQDGETITCRMASCTQAHLSRAQEQPETWIV